MDAVVEGRLTKMGHVDGRMMKKLAPSLALIELLKLLGVAALYALAAWLVLANFAPKGEVTTFFLPSGIALAALLLGGRRYFWAVLAGAFIANLLFLNDPWLSALKACGSALGAWIAAWLIMLRGTFNLGLRHLKDLLLLSAGGFAGAALGRLTTLE